jgi:YfiH family protein
MRRAHGILVAFSERTGGVSDFPYASLNLAEHVGDDPAAVDTNRSRLLEGLGIGALRDDLTMSEQVHGDSTIEVLGSDAGSGGRVSGGRAPLAASDAMITVQAGVPLMMCYADCVPVVLASTGPLRAVAVVHAGWRGCLARLPGKTAVALARRVGCEPSDLVAYIGPHIGVAEYAVGPEVASQFTAEFATIPSARGHVDLGAVVSASLRDVGVPTEQQVSVDFSTAEHTDKFYSFRVSGTTGRHGALAVVL